MPEQNATDKVSSVQNRLPSDEQLGWPLERPIARHFLLDDSPSIRFPFWVWGLTLVFAAWGTLTVNPLLTPLAVVLLPVCAQLLWRRGEPPVLVFACAMQWLQASASIFYTNFQDLPLERYGGSEVEMAVGLTLIAVLMVAFGMRIGLIGAGHSRLGELMATGAKIQPGKLFFAYLVAFLVSSGAGMLAFRMPAITQIIFAFTTLKWVPVFLLAYSVLEQRRGYGLLGIVILFEFSVGLLGYFSAFKSVFLLLIVVALTSPLALHGKRLAITVSVAGMLIIFGIVWSAVKSDYREVLNQGTDTQQVLAPVEERLATLQELIGRLTWEGVNDGLEAMILRISYVNFFALTIANVPDNVPYENGALWFGSLKHVVTPRMFFPDKPSLDDSERTTLYTGVQVAGVEQGTSIGIGYVGESYIDFGPVFMFVPILLLGVFYGIIYRCFIIRARHKLLGSAIASSMLIFSACSIDTSNIKLLGGIITALLVMSALYKIFGRRFIQWLGA